MTHEMLSKIVLSRKCLCTTFLFVFTIIFILLTLSWENFLLIYRQKMGEVNIKSLLPNKSLFNSVVVHGSLHDSNLQVQETLLFNRLNFPFIIYPWKAICDERNEDILPKAIVILALSDLSFKPPFSNGLDDLMRCYAFDGNHKTLDYVSRVYIFMKAWFFKGIVAVCPFDQKLNCPSYVTLYTLENSKVKTTNMLKVEKQPNDHGSILDILRHFGDQFESFYLPPPPLSLSYLSLYLSFSLSLSLSLSLSPWFKGRIQF